MSVESKEDVMLQLQNFLQFVCEGKCATAESVITSSISVLNNCPSGRNAVLQFYWQLYAEYCEQYCFTQLPHCQTETFTGLPGRLWNRFAPSPSQVSVISTAETCRKIEEEEETPASPQQSSDVKSIKAGTTSVLSSWDSLINEIGNTLLLYVKQDTSFTKLITEWARSLAADLSVKFPREKVLGSSFMENDQNSNLPNIITFWLKCPVMKQLSDLILSGNSTDMASTIKNLIVYSPNTDWILAHLITTFPNSEFTASVEQLLQSGASSFSITAIMSYLSEHNPKAIINCSKSNISLLLKLCSNSKPLLNVLVQEASKQSKKIQLNCLSRFFITIFNFSKHKNYQ